MSEEINVDYADSAVEQFEPSEMTSNEKPQTKDEKKYSSHWEVRTEERPYAFLPDQPVKEKNRYGKRIDLVELTDHPKERSLFINENPVVGCNPNRNKQHGFYFNADNCIGCHACESACSEKNENPAHIAFRSVGYVEGGSYPDYKRQNISMACNHCDDPVCLKGCPTGAYRKYAEYGAVIQDPETCFGCGYCTWVCPYNAPQLDPVKGQVSKCNMCVDRLEVGLKPACVSACVGNALDFGVIENTPENREQCKTEIPGFPTPEITHPNIRFQQTKTLPSDMKRTDSAPVKYSKDSEGNYKPAVDQKKGKTKSWNLAQLSSRENPLVLFTLLAQAAVGAFTIVFLGLLLNAESFVTFSNTSLFSPMILSTVALTALALLMSVTHLGKPIRFYRGFNNLRYSPMAREGFGLVMFAVGTGLTALFTLVNNDWLNAQLISLFGADLVFLNDSLPIESLVTGFGVFAIIAGFAGLFYMNKCYQIKARPFWNHLQTATAFVGNSLSLGSTVAALVVLPTLAVLSVELSNVLFILGALFTAGVFIESLGLIAHNKTLNSVNNEGAAAHYIQCTTFGKTYILRNVLLGLIVVVGVGLLSSSYGEPVSNLVIIAWAVLAIFNVCTSLIGRSLFYVLVIPTTMPGAFFWKNKSFEQHARDIGLADNPAVGVAKLEH